MNTERLIVRLLGTVAESFPKGTWPPLHMWRSASWWYRHVASSCKLLQPPCHSVLSPGTMTHNTPSLPEVYLVGVSYHNRKRNCGSTHVPELEKASQELPTSPCRSKGSQVLNKIKRCRAGERHSVRTRKAPNVYLVVLPVEAGKRHGDCWYNDEWTESHKR